MEECRSQGIPIDVARNFGLVGRDFDLRFFHESGDLMQKVPESCRAFYRKLVVSCQAPDGDPFQGPDLMARFARVAVEGGAAGIRANGAEDVLAIDRAVTAPIIGIQKRLQEDGRVLITPSVQDAKELVLAGADIIALDCTCRGMRMGALERVQQIKQQLGVPVMADIATLEEARVAADTGVDLVATTLRGYTEDTQHIQSFETRFVAELVRQIPIPVVVEGRVSTPQQARSALDAGAFAIVVGTAITRPGEITRHFAQALESVDVEETTLRYFIGIDLGGTNTKYGLVSGSGELIWSGYESTPEGGGRQILLDHLWQIAWRCQQQANQIGIHASGLGIATAGCVDPFSGRVVYATENLPGWTGTLIASELQKKLPLPVAVENDANALAAAESSFGLAKGMENFVCITLGTGVGGGCFVDGKLVRGAHFYANALGHISLDPHGPDCTCGRRGCLEVFTNAAALMRYSEGLFRSAEELIGAANGGNPGALGALHVYAEYLTMGIASIVRLLDPELIILSGGIAQDNPILLKELNEGLQAQVPFPQRLTLRISVSDLGYYGGVIGAAAAAQQLVSRTDIT
jgi:N-acetylmannosamine-6-phosphate 2-epimerase / N-acetylmannosamine kinase